MKTRTILVVEDEEFYNTVYKMYCEEVLRELPHIEGRIEQAYDYEQAKHILDTQPVDFISVDIALSQDEQGLTDQKRDKADAGGMTLLKELQNYENRPIPVVVTGQTLQSYAVEAYREYGTLAFYQKTRFDDKEYKNAIKAALYYLDATEALAQPQTELDIDAAADSWQKALESAQIAGIKEQHFPEALGYKIEAMRPHSITGLPTGAWTAEKLKNSIVGREDNWALIRVRIKGLNKFVANFTSQEEPIFVFVAKLLRQTREKFADREIFIGHLGHREHISEPNFVIIPGQTSQKRVGKIAAWLEERFAQTDIRLFIPDLEVERSELDIKQLTLALETWVLPDDEYNFFPDLHFLLDTLGTE